MKSQLFKLFLLILTGVTLVGCGESRPVINRPEMPTLEAGNFDADEADIREEEIAPLPIASPEAQAPASALTAEIFVGDNSGEAPLSISFKGVATGAVGNSTLEWELNGRPSATGPEVTLPFFRAGTYELILKVKDESGQEAVAIQMLTLTARAAPANSNNGGQSNTNGLITNMGNFDVSYDFNSAPPMPSGVALHH